MKPEVYEELLNSDNINNNNKKTNQNNFKWQPHCSCLADWDEILIIPPETHETKYMLHKTIGCQFWLLCQPKYS